MVTYEAPERLASLLHDLAQQTVRPGRVVVVNNGRREPVDAVIAAHRVQGLPSLEVTVVHSPVNDGPAGGHFRSMSVALEGGAEWLWVMDDDLVLPADCLQALLEQGRATVGPVLVRPGQLAADGSLQNYPGWYAVLLNRAAVERGGLPNADLVWWVEDTEYLQWRLGRCGVPTLNGRVAVRHGEARPERRPPAWKTYYETRNSVWYRWHTQRRVRWRRLLRILPRLCLQAMVAPEPLRGVRAFLAGLVDGFRGRLGLRWPLPGGDTGA